MSNVNEPEVKEEKIEEAPVQPLQSVVGSVTISLSPNGALEVNGPQNALMALAILKAGETYLQMQLQDGMRRAQAMRPPTILKAGADALAKIHRPS